MWLAEWVCLRLHLYIYIYCTYVLSYLDDWTQGEEMKPSHDAETLKGEQIKDVDYDTGYQTYQTYTIPRAGRCTIFYDYVIDAWSHLGFYC
jgi:hypothetical protein